MENLDSFYFSVPGVPKGKGRPRFTGRGRAYTPKATRDYERAVREAALEQARIMQFLKYPPKTALRVSVIAWFPVPVSWPKWKREAAAAGDIYPTGKPDADNILKVLDALNGVLWHDDAQIVEAVGRKRYCAVGGAPRLFVFVEPMPAFPEEDAEAEYDGAKAA